LYREKLSRENKEEWKGVGFTLKIKKRPDGIANLCT
jgi:hypothetical protein